VSGTLRRNAGVLAAFGACFALTPLLPLGLNAYYVQILAYIGINAILAVSLQLINGVAGQFSLGHAGFMAIGAYVAAAWAVFAVPAAPPPVQLWSGLVAGGLAAAAAGLAVGIPTLRLRGDYLAIATLGFGEIIRVVILNTDAVGGARGMIGIPVLASVGTIAACVVLCTVVVWRLAYSAEGRALRAVREDEVAAAAVGIDPARRKILAFTVGAAWAGVAGGCFAFFIGYLNTNSFQFLRSVEIVVMVVLGGLGSVTGALVAAALLTILPEVLRPIAEYRMIIYSALLIVLMLVRPEGLLGGGELLPWRSSKPATAR